MIWFKISLPHKRHILITIITPELQRDPALMTLATGKHLLTIIIILELPKDPVLMTLVIGKFT